MPTLLMFSIFMGPYHAMYCLIALRERHCRSGGQVPRVGGERSSPGKLYRKLDDDSQNERRGKEALRQRVRWSCRACALPWRLHLAVCGG
ncbi:hypothetical protein BKA81DRAFT_344743 [Phyllosticta paracitricarpa]